MICSKELLTPRELSLRDFRKILPKLIPDSNTLLVSDFDETLCSSYQYNADTKTHIPVLKPELVAEATRMRSPFIIATSRSAKEPVVRDICTQMVQEGAPMICENGAVIFFPTTGNSVTLVRNEQRQLLDDIGSYITSIQTTYLDRGKEVLIAKDRVATMELRAQELSGIGAPELYPGIIEDIYRTFYMDGMEIVSSNNSVCIQPNNISKGNALKIALDMMGLGRESFFVVGLGDAPNDQSIFKNSNLSVAVRPHAKDFADYFVNSGDETSLTVMRSLK